MTSHRLVRCDPAQLVRRAGDLHPATTARPAADPRLPRWRYREPPPDRCVGWWTGLPDGSVIGWCLEVERAANGTLVHLTAAPVAGPLRRLPARLQRLGLQPWTEHALTVLARPWSASGRRSS